jgi:hypothetical protein
MIFSLALRKFESAPASQQKNQTEAVELINQEKISYIKTK